MNSDENHNVSLGSGEKRWKEQAAQSLADSRRRTPKDRMKEFDSFHKNMDKGTKQAGKGDGRRPGNQEMYEAGYMATFAETPQEREKWAARWRALRDGKGVNDER
jgi:hypothetical protein